MKRWRFQDLKSSINSLTTAMHLVKAMIDEALAQTRVTEIILNIVEKIYKTLRKVFKISVLIPILTMNLYVLV